MTQVNQDSQPEHGILNEVKQGLEEKAWHLFIVLANWYFPDTQTLDSGLDVPSSQPFL